MNILTKTILAAFAVAGLSMAGPASAQTRISCPLPDAHRTITNPLPEGWWTTPIVDRLSKDMIDAIRSPDVREQFASKGFVPIANTPEEFRRMIENDIARWGPLLRELGLVK